MGNINASKGYKIAILSLSLALFLLLGYVRLSGSLPPVYHPGLMITVALDTCIALLTVRLLMVDAEKHRYIPVFKRMALYRQDGSVIREKTGRYEVESKVIIKVWFKGDPQTIRFFFVPKGEQGAHLREELGFVYSPDAALWQPGVGKQRTVEWMWDVPHKELRGCLGVALIDGEYAYYKPKALLVANTPTREGGSAI